MSRNLAMMLILALAAPAAAETPKVVTDLPPVASLVDQVLGDLGRAETLMDRGADAHHYQMRPSQARALQDAQLLVWIGPQMTPWLERGAASLGSGEALRLIELTPGQAFADAQDHGAEHGDHDDHDDHGGVDPHLWLDPSNAAIWLPVIADRLGQIDPENAATYAQNAQAAAESLASLDAELRAELDPIRDRSFGVQHDAYGYFTRHYGLQPAVALAAGDAADPGAARLREIAREIRDHDIACLFPEANHSDRQMALIAQETGARLGAPLDPEGSNHAPGPDLYAATLRGIAGNLVECLGVPKS